MTTNRWGLVATILALLALGFAAMSTSPPFTVPTWVPVMFLEGRRRPSAHLGAAPNLAQGRECRSPRAKQLAVSLVLRQTVSGQADGVAISRSSLVWQEGPTRISSAAQPETEIEPANYNDGQWAQPSHNGGKREVSALIALFDSSALLYQAGGQQRNAKHGACEHDQSQHPGRQPPNSPCAHKEDGDQDKGDKKR